MQAAALGVAQVNGTVTMVVVRSVRVLVVSLAMNFPLWMSCSSSSLVSSAEKGEPEGGTNIKVVGVSGHLPRKI